MRTVVSTVCNNWYSGTDQEVRLDFKSIKKTPGKEDKVHKCRTEILNTDENDWATGGTQTWGYTEASTFTMYGQPVAGEDKQTTGTTMCMVPGAVPPVHQRGHDT